MLQQTQVTTVIQYFLRFVDHFPTLEALAKADVDQVLALWSGLGYYARARNLHKAAQCCLTQYSGQLPNDAEELRALPGIGRSTANAIIAQAYDRRAPILDGNVKRVIARHRGIEGWPGQIQIENILWYWADQYTPEHSAANYTQAIMDLGATVCTRAHPKCSACPVASDCDARRNGHVLRLPTPKPKQEKQRLELHLGIFFDAQGQVLLEKRADGGVWGGLWCFPDANMIEQMRMISPGPVFSDIRHLLTHRIMHIRLLSCQVAPVTESRAKTAWFCIEDALALGLPKPIRTTLNKLADHLSC